MPCLIAIHQDATGSARDLVLAYAKGIGGTRAGVISTTSRTRPRPTCSASRRCCAEVSPSWPAPASRRLWRGGYDPRLAYFECLHELKLIVDLMYEKGIQGMRDSISNTAEYGDMTRGKRVISDETRQAMRQILADIQSGEFAREGSPRTAPGPRAFSGCAPRRATTRSRRSERTCAR